MRPLRATSGLEDWRALLADPERHWRAGFSAMAAAQSWEAGFPPEVAGLLGAEAELQLAIVEHKVPLPGGGSPSQCDVFALVRADGRDIAVAVEAKVAEPFGPLMSEWLAEPSAGKTRRIAAIEDWLGAPSAPAHLRYQLLHRTAAAIAEARRFRRPAAAMIVQSFSPNRDWFADFEAFASYLGAGPVAPDVPVEIALHDGMALRIGWATGDPKFLRDGRTP